MGVQVDSIINGYMDSEDDKNVFKNSWMAQDQLENWMNEDI